MSGKHTGTAVDMSEATIYFICRRLHSLNPTRMLLTVRGCDVLVNVFTSPPPPDNRHRTPDAGAPDTWLSDGLFSSLPLRSERTFEEAVSCRQRDVRRLFNSRMSTTWQNVDLATNASVFWGLYTNNDNSDD